MNWEQAMIRLADQVTDWVGADLVRRGYLAGSTTEMVPTPGEPLLVIDADSKAVLRLEPAEHAAKELPAQVYLYTWPTLRRVLLIGPDQKDNWQIETSQGVPMNYPWTKDSFLELVQALAEPHAKSV